MAYLEVEAGRLLRPAAPTTDASSGGVDPVQHLGRLFTRGVSALSHALQLPDEPSSWNGGGGGGGEKEAPASAGSDAVQRFWRELRSISWCPVR